MPSELQRWVGDQIEAPISSIEALIPEASTRRFWRVVCHGEESYMAMHAPPQTENNEMFIRLSKTFRRHGIPVPVVLASDLVSGYLLVEDFGSREYLQAYAESGTDHAISLALSNLIKIQSVKSSEIPAYTREDCSMKCNSLRSGSVKHCCKSHPTH